MIFSLLHAHHGTPSFLFLIHRDTELVSSCGTTDIRFVHRGAGWQHSGIYTSKNRCFKKTRFSWILYFLPFVIWISLDLFHIPNLLGYWTTAWAWAPTAWVSPWRWWPGWCSACTWCPAVLCLSPTPAMMVGMICSTRTPHMVARTRWCRGKIVKTVWTVHCLTSGW